MITDNLAHNQAIFNKKHFAEDALFNGVTITGIFNNGFAVSELGEYGGISNKQSSFTFDSVNLPPSMEQGLEIVIRGTYYNIKEIQNDQGLTTVTLNVNE